MDRVIVTGELGYPEGPASPTEAAHTSGIRVGTAGLIATEECHRFEPIVAERNRA
jgi:hypothetical protein